MNHDRDPKMVRMPCPINPKCIDPSKCSKCPELKEIVLDDNITAEEPFVTQNEVWYHPQ